MTIDCRQHLNTVQKELMAIGTDEPQVPGHEQDLTLSVDQKGLVPTKVLSC